MTGPQFQPGDPPPRQTDGTIAQIVQALRQLAEGDRLRVLKFVQDIAADRAIKRATRRARFKQTEPDESWRIGQ